MRYAKSLWKVSPALLATAALVLVAGGATAIFNSANGIQADIPNYLGSFGYVDGFGDTYETGVGFTCVDLNSDFAMGCFSTHPDNVTISPKQGKVDQKKKDNNAIAWISAQKLDGVVLDPEIIEQPLLCKKVQIKGKSNDDKETIESKCTLTKCDLPGGLTLDDLAAIGNCIDDSEDAGLLGKKVQTLKLDNNNQLKGNIWSKGTWENL
jgi:hypothetical protein